MSIIIKNGVVTITDKRTGNVDTVDTTTMSKHKRGQYGKDLAAWKWGGEKGYAPAPRR